MASFLHGLTPYSFFSMRGSIDPSKERLSEITRPGVDGTAFKAVGRRGAPFQVVTTTLFTLDTIATAKVAYSNLVSAIVSVTDDFGDTWNLILIEDMRILETRNLLASQPTGYVAMMRVEWTMRSLATVY